MLLNPLVTAATAVVLYTLARRLDYRPRAAFALGLVYGLGTFAIAYTRTLFGEPLAALLLLVAVLWAHDGRVARAGAALGLLVGVNTVYSVMIPIVGAYLFMPHTRVAGAGFTALAVTGRSEGRPYNLAAIARRLLAFLLPLALAAALLAVYNAARFGSPLSSGYHFAEGEGFTRPILTGLYGLFLSPFRGLFLYNPILLLAIPGWWMLRQRDARLAWLMLALVAACALAFAGWWSWHGGIVWGPRFLIPVLPLAALMLAPVVERVLGGDDARNAASLRKTDTVLPLRLLFGLLLVVSLAVQALGTLYSVYPYVNEVLNARYWTGEFDSTVTALRDEVLYTPSLSPIAGHATMALSGRPIDAGWAADGGNLPHVLAAGLVITAAVGILVMPRFRAGAQRTAPVQYLVLPMVFACGLVVAAAHANSPEAARIRALNAALQPPGTVVAATTLFGSGLLDLDGQRVISMNAPTTPDDPWAARLWRYALERGGRLWLVTWFGAGDPLNWQERDLWERAAFTREIALEGHRALLFSLAADPPLTSVGETFGALRLDAAGTAMERDGVRVALAWSAATPPDKDYTWFVHLLDAAGNIVAQQDRPPQGGYRPTSGWSTGETVTDRLFFPIVPGTDKSGWALRVGWVNPQTGEPLAPFILLPLPDDA
jgi:hypothetical protein